MTEAEKSVVRIGTKLVALSRAGKGLEAIETLYDEKIVSIEPQEGEEMPARIEGIEAVRGKSSWWSANHEIHSMAAEGPFCGYREDRFAVRFEMDVTFKPSGKRTQMTEIALYTVSDDKIVQEEFMYGMS